MCHCSVITYIAINNFTYFNTIHGFSLLRISCKIPHLRSKCKAYWSLKVVENGKCDLFIIILHVLHIPSI